MPASVCVCGSMCVSVHFIDLSISELLENIRHSSAWSEPHYYVAKPQNFYFKYVISSISSVFSLVLYALRWEIVQMAFILFSFIFFSPFEYVRHLRNRCVLTCYPFRIGQLNAYTNTYYRICNNSNNNNSTHTTDIIILNKVEQKMVNIRTVARSIVICVTKWNAAIGSV